ncbi:MAG: 4-hydroxy-tetrahydrodipicolinate reductase [Saprospiraceae bacterium]
MQQLKIGILGYGKMGKAVEALATARGHEIAWRAGSQTVDLLHARALRMADVVIEFSRPEAAQANVLRCIDAGVPVVSGTTGWQSALADTAAYCLKMQGAMLWASNFSVGVNVFFAINRYAAAILGPLAEYLPSLEEIHHVHKLDAPSGTAVTLAEDLIAAAGKPLASWRLQEEAELATDPSALPVRAFRIGETPGTHTVRWEGPNDRIVLAHEAHNRTGFAEGAVRAAEWLHGRKGVYSMRDVLGL